MSEVRQIDPFHVKGPDGVVRSLDEHYDGMQDVAQDPYGAWLSIQNLCTRLAEVENERDDLSELLDKANEQNGRNFARTERAEDALRMIVSHATGGETTGDGMSVNDISVRITAFRNVLWEEAKKVGAREAEAALATARRDALEEAATFYDNSADFMRDRAAAIRALIAQEEPTT